MFKRLIAKGNLHGSDYLRALITDTSPGDVPIVFSNDGFYRNLKTPSANEHHRQFLDKLLKPPRAYTIPYRYNILKGVNSTRKLSLVHPAAQIGVADLYKEYVNLICYYCSKSPASIRSPRKIGGTFFVRGPFSDVNKIKDAKIDTVNIESSVSNPASYFAYEGYDRAFKFFESTDYMRLEKRYAVMYMSDISKCFSSIYTHTLFWATADIPTAKDNTRSNNFSNKFDRLMQSMNYNETNGICIGAEVSRIFAEIILSSVDADVIDRLGDSQITFRMDYEFRRYVDDYIIFAINQDVANKVMNAIRSGLAKFNLHISEEKTHCIPRPFVTKKSKFTREADRILREFFEKFIDTGRDGVESYNYPRRIRRHNALLRSLIESIKSSCFDHEAGYDMAANYVIGALVVRIGALIDGYDRGIAHESVNEDSYIASLSLLLEAAYFFYTVEPSVPSSLRIAQAAVRCSDFFRQRMPERLPFLAEQVVRWTFQFIRSLQGTTKHRDTNCVPLEALNILLILGEMGREEVLAHQVIREFCDATHTLQYFEIVSILFCIGGDQNFEDLRNVLFDQARKIIFENEGVQSDAQGAHLALDILSCPYLSVERRASLLHDLRNKLELAQISRQELNAAVAAFEERPWFVDWSNLSLLRMIRKKELSAVY